MLGSLTSQQMENVPNQDPSLLNNQMTMTGPVSTGTVSRDVVKQPETYFTRNNVGLPVPLLSTKRKAAVAPLVANKRVVHLEAHVNSPRLSQQSGLSNKKMMRNESVSIKTVSPRVQTSKSKIGPPEVSPKVQKESYEAMRMKMRETLAAALSVDNQDKDNFCGEDKSGPQEVGSTSIKPNTTPVFTDGSTEGEKPQYNYVMPDTDASFSDAFFVKDELLQGNGLSWVWDIEVEELKEAQADEISNSVPIISSPQELAVRIEAELFKLFGGVNKKYKEKGRSLMFNLKDPNNPELREKVVSTKISPERLCSMTPEELASKELSEWRMAKAEELDKMIVLPDSDVDMRRLVKKTHKGEYQIEVDQDNDDGVSVEVSVGSSSLSRFREKTKKDHLSSSADDEVKDKVVAVSADGSDLMQELIVDGEFKDEGFLPPIVSLDEFMESLDSEPPFETLSIDAKETKAQLVKDKSESDGRDYEKVSSASHVEAEAYTNNKLKVTDTETSETSAERKLSPSFSDSACESLWEGDLQLTLSSTVPVIGVYKSGEKTSTKEWPGSMEIKGRVRLEAFEKFLQELPMSRSRAVMVVHFVLKDASSEYNQAALSEAVDSYVAEERVGFGEPHPGVEVYLCPPYKRITETLNSRLLSKEHIDILKSLENGLIGVVVWRRAKPSSNMLHHKHHRKHISSRKQKNLNSNTNFNMTSKSTHFQPLQSNNGDNVVIDDDDDDVPPGFGPGVVVARNEDDLPEFNFSNGSNSSGQTLRIPAQSGLGSRMIPPRPVSHMRQLINEYGQTGNNNNATSGSTSQNGIRGSGIESRQWNKDDDDIPEWQPQLQKHSIQELSRVHLVDQVRSIMGQIVNPVMPIQQPANLMQNGWVLPPAPHSIPPNAILPGQYYGGNWQQNDPRGGGF